MSRIRRHGALAVLLAAAGLAARARGVDAPPVPSGALEILTDRAGPGRPDAPGVRGVLIEPAQVLPDARTQVRILEDTLPKIVSPGETVPVYGKVLILNDRGIPLPDGVPNATVRLVDVFNAQRPLPLAYGATDARGDFAIEWRVRPKTADNDGRLTVKAVYDGDSAYRPSTSMEYPVELWNTTVFQAGGERPKDPPVIRGKTIYGDDNRLDLYEIQDHPQLLRLAESTVALFQASRVTPDASGGSAGLTTVIFGQKMNLCKDQRFWEQPMGSFCSGALVGPDLIMTAGHCVFDQAKCGQTKFVFGFSILRAGETPATVPAKDVYGCRQLLGMEHGSADWALVRLDRPVADHPPLAINRSGVLANGTPVAAIGHPTGLPTKVAGGAKVRDASPSDYFIANTDTFGGNSGSAVVNADTGLIEGILVRGGQDFAFDPNRQCWTYYRCADDGCDGEESTKVSVIASRIPLPSSSKAAARVERPDAESVSTPMKAVHADAETSGRQ